MEEKAQEQLAKLKEWFFRILKDASKPYWILYVNSSESGRPKGTKRDYHESTDLESSWGHLEKALTDAWRLGLLTTGIEISKGGKHDASSKVFQYFGLTQGSSIQATTAGIFGATQPQPIGAPVGYVPQSQYQSDLSALEQRMLERFEHKEELRERDERIAALEQGQLNPFDRFMDACERILDRLPEQVQQTIAIGLMQRLSPHVGPVGSTATAPQGMKVTEQPGTGQVPENDLNEDYQQAIQAVDFLAANGVESPGALILKLAPMYLENRPMIDQFIKAQPEATEA